MAQTLTFSQLIDSSYKVTRSLLKTYILGALVLMLISLLLRGISAGFFAVIELPTIENNLIVLITVFFLGIVFAIAGAIFQILQTMFALIVAIDRTKDVKAGVRKTWKSLWKLIVGGIWMMLRSFAWVAFLGLPFVAVGFDTHNQTLTMIGWLIVISGAGCGIYFFPRLIFTNVIQIKDGTGARASANLSIQRTEGYWGKIVGNNILMALSMMLLTGALFAVVALIGFMMVAILRALPTIVAVIIGLPVGLVLVIAAIIYFFGVTLFGQVYMVELYATIKANPKVAAR